jgi:hypothetical protein
MIRSIISKIHRSEQVRPVRKEPDHADMTFAEMLNRANALLEENGFGTDIKRRDASGRNGDAARGNHEIFH